ncbi:MAG: S8 family serine peptidase [Bryobacteraceae bacterium]
MMLRKLFFLLPAFLAPLAGQEPVPGRYIVEFTGAPAARHAQPERRRAEIRAERQRAEALLRARRARIRATVDTVLNAAVVDAPDAAALRRVPGVRRVSPVRVYELFLNRALVNHKAAEAWDLCGGVESAGKGAKIAILDTGIDPRHPGFQPPAEWQFPEGYPMVSEPAEENLALTNPKIVVARSFDRRSARDRNGHGTAVAMVAAGLRHESPRGVISGMAPAALLGVYRVSNPEDGLIYSDVVLQALDWAVKDGMDVINMSFGSVGAFSSDDDPLAEAVRNAASAGIIVVNAAGNTAGPMTVDDTASSENVIAVGANDAAPENVSQVVPSVGLPAPAQPSSNVQSQEPIMGPLANAAWFGDRYGCSPYPGEALRNRIPLIERGQCLFHEKLALAAAAGAPAAIVFNTAIPPTGSPEDLVIMNVDDNPTIPGLFIRNSDGTRLQEYLTFFEDLQVTLRFPSPNAVPDRISLFSSRGPSVDLRIKPDLLATGSPIYTAAVIDDGWNCDICDPTGYASLSGTSFSAPLVAGAAAVLKAARPGLGFSAWRSMLINAASPFRLSNGETAAVNSAGAGMLDLERSLKSMIAAEPVSLSFGASGPDVQQERELRLRNLSDRPVTLAIAVETSDEARPEAEPAEATVAPGEAAVFTVRFRGTGLQPGPFQGFLKVREVKEEPPPEEGASSKSEGRTASSGGEGEGGRDGELDPDSGEEPDPSPAALPEIRIPYWLGVRGSGPESLVVLRTSPRNPRPLSTVRVYFRVHDRAGLPMEDISPRVVPVSGGGTVRSVSASGSVYPNSWMAEIRTGLFAGPNVFEVELDGRIFSFQVTTSN